MIGVGCLVFCDRCETATARAVRGWRAYLIPDEDCEGTSVTVLCPDCAERRVGEDETTWAQ